MEPGRERYATLNHSRWLTTAEALFFTWIKTWIGLRTFEKCIASHWLHSRFLLHIVF